MYEGMWSFDLNGALAELAGFSGSLATAKPSNDGGLSGISSISSSDRPDTKASSEIYEANAGGLAPAKNAKDAKTATGAEECTANKVLKAANHSDSNTIDEADLYGQVSTSQMLAGYQQRALEADSIQALQAVLMAFHCEPWELVARRDMHASYTPHARWLLRQREDGARLLEDLASLCWNKPKQEAAITATNPININSRPFDDSYPAALPADITCWIIEALKAASPDAQNEWWLALGRWAADHHYFEWAHAVHEQLATEWDEVMK